MSKHDSRRDFNGEARLLLIAGIAIVALASETCRSAATRLAVHELKRLPVVADASSHRLIGLVSRSDLIKATLAVHGEEQERLTFRRLSFRAAPAPLERG